MRPISIFSGFLIALGLLTTVSVGAQQNENQGLSTGNAHQVVVTSSPMEGLEIGIPQQSWYAKGIALDLQGRFEESYGAYQKAIEEFEHQLKSRPHWAKMIRGWKLKALFQKSQSEILKPRRGYSYGSYSSTLTYHRVAALHNKWLGIRAFTGQAPRKLAEQIVDRYERIIQRSPYDDSTRIALAAMYHEIGRHAEGKRMFAKVRYPSRSYLAREIAYYHTAAGDKAKAFAFLEKAIKHSSRSREHVLSANDFDHLRTDPRFRRLVGEP